MQANLEKLIEGYDAGCIVGDQEYAFWNILAYAVSALYAGQEPTTLAQVLKKYVKRAIQCQRASAARCITILLHAALELSGDTDSENIYEHLLNTTEDAILLQNDHRACIQIYTKRKFSLILKDDMDGAIEVYGLSSNRFGPRFMFMKTTIYTMSVFLDGLIAFYAARKNKNEEEHWLAIGMDSLTLMKKWARLSTWNFESKLLLLEAEHLFQEGNALEKYEASIIAARNHRFKHEEGLAHSKLGYYHLSHGRKADAAQSFVQAKRCYMQWGAHSLLKRIEDLDIQT